MSPCENITFSDSELNRYSRQMRLSEIGREGQESIKRSSVVVIGAGALGCPVLQYLTAAGVGTIGIVDNDWVDLSNLHRQVLYGMKDIEKPKPVAVKEKLQFNNPDINLKVHYTRLTNENALSLLRNYEIIVDCSDNFPTRYLINDSAVILKKPVVYGAVQRFSGQLMVLNYNNGPTLRCIYPEIPHILESPSCETEGVLGPVAGIIGSMQATETIKIILGMNGILSGKLFYFDSRDYTSQIFSFKKDPFNSIVNELGIYDDLCLSEKDLVKEITSEKLKLILSDYPDLKVIDLRDEPEKKDIGFKTLSIPFNDLQRSIKLIPEKGPKVFYCGGGVKSSIAINYLNKVLNMSDLYSLII